MASKLKPATYHDLRNTIVPTDIPTHEYGYVRYENVIVKTLGREVTLADGTSDLRYTVTLQVGYFDEEHRWCHRQELTRYEILPAIEALRRSYITLERSHHEW
jgi:hypothetical protein